jgi:hypothetical protein
VENDERKDCGKGIGFPQRRLRTLFQTVLEMDRQDNIVLKRNFTSIFDMHTECIVAIRFQSCQAEILVWMLIISGGL